jgi:hypothetical protein
MSSRSTKPNDSKRRVYQKQSCRLFEFGFNLFLKRRYTTNGQLLYYYYTTPKYLSIDFKIAMTSLTYDGWMFSFLVVTCTRTVLRGTL